MDSAIVIRNISKNFGRHTVLNNVSFSVPRGSVFGLLGPNGAGKTTLMGLIAGFLRPTSGDAQVLGVDVGSIDKLAGKIGILPQDAKFLRGMSVGKQLVLYAKMSGVCSADAHKEALAVLTKVGLADSIDKKPKELSHGMHKRLGIAQALIGNPEVVILDEPKAGLDPASASIVRQIVRGFGPKVTLVISSHDLAEIQRMCSHVAILDKGILQECTAMESLTKGSERVRMRFVRPLQTQEIQAVLGTGVLFCEARGQLQYAMGLPRTVNERPEGREALLAKVVTVLAQTGAVPRSIEDGSDLGGSFFADDRRGFLALSYTEYIRIAKQWISLDANPSTKSEMQRLVDLAVTESATVDTAAVDSTGIDQRTKDQAQEELRNRFSGRLQFGTAGIRAEMGAGPSRINDITIQQITCGLAEYLVQEVSDAKQRGVVVGYDARHGSHRFAGVVVSVLQRHGFPVMLSNDICPTPLVGFWVVENNATAGVMITASHNPPQYNGYKLFWSDGIQVTYPHDKNIENAMPPWQQWQQTAHNSTQKVEGPPAQLLTPGGYLRQSPSTSKHSLRIGYSALHGVAGELVVKELTAAGYDDITIKADQFEPDGNFPTTNNPNPEDSASMTPIVSWGIEQGVELLFVNDPDGDRLAVAAHDGDSGSDSLRVFVRRSSRVFAR